MRKNSACATFVPVGTNALVVLMTKAEDLVFLICTPKVMFSEIPRKHAPIEIGCVLFCDVYVVSPVYVATLEFIL